MMRMALAALFALIPALANGAEALSCAPVYVYFYSNDSGLAPQAMPAISAGARVLIEGNLSAIVAGHTDGQEGDDQPLSERRAAAVSRELVRLGVRPERLKTVGKGLAEPLAPIAPNIAESFNRYVMIDFCGPERFRK